MFSLAGLLLATGTILVRRRRRVAVLAAATSLMVGCADELASEHAEHDRDSQVPVTREELRNGTSTSIKPGIGQVQVLGNCSATLISPRHVLTASHCNGHLDTLSGNPTFTAGGFTAGGATRNVTRVYRLGGERPPGGAIPPGNLDFNPDVLLLELDSDIPAANAIPLNVAAGPPLAGTQVTMFGFGPNGSDCSGPGGNKRFVPFNFGDFTGEFCPGDSGGPAIYGLATDNGPIFGVASFVSGNGDVWGNVSRYKEDILSVIRLWNNGPSGLTGLETGFLRAGQSFDLRTNTSALACQTLCNNNSRCNSFRHQTSTNTCSLIGVAGDWTPDADFTSGLSSTNRYENDFDRRGFDYTNYATSLENCSSDCSDDSRCAAFSWVQGTCYLKEFLSNPAPAVGVISGTKRNFEYYTDRPGGDISNFVLTTADMRECQSACSAEPACRSYTYIKQRFDVSMPYVIAEEAHCWLKGVIEPAVTIVSDPPSGRKAYISGTKRSTPSASSPVPVPVPAPAVCALFVLFGMTGARIVRSRGPRLLKVPSGLPK